MHTQTNEEKSEFISTICHQLRSPNTIVYGYTSMLLEGDYGELSDIQKEAIQHISDASTLLNNLINELLDVHRINEKKMKYSFTDFDIVAVIKDIFKRYKAIAKKKNLKLVENFNKEKHINIRGDKEKIKQSMINMFDNAIKYTSRGSVAIGVLEENKNVQIIFEDTGIGINKDEINNLFKKFVRTSNAESHSVAGSGLGLFIAKEIIVSNGGKITAYSEGEGQGSKFVIEFPIC